MGNCYTVGPNQALVVSGGCTGSKKRQIVVGGWAWAWCALSDVQTLSMEIMTVTPHCTDVQTLHGVPVTLNAVSQCKFLTESKLLNVAIEQFLGKTVLDIQDVLLQTLEGHLRAITGTLSVEDLYQDREKFAALVREVASPDVGKMGVEILSFTIKDIRDKVGYLEALGKKKTAEIKRDADVGVALAQRDAGVKISEAERSMMDVKFHSESEIANSQRAFTMQRSSFEQEVNTKKAEANLAYELESAKLRQAIRSESVQIQVVERKKQIEVQEHEITRKDNELVATVRKPAEAERFRMETLAHAARTVTVQAGIADAEKIKQMGGAEAASISARGLAEAEGMRIKADAYRKYGDAANTNRVLESLPKLAAEIAAPLGTIDEIIMVNVPSNGWGGNVSNTVIQTMAVLPVAIQAITGTDLTKLLDALPGAQPTAVV